MDTPRLRATIPNQPFRGFLTKKNKIVYVDAGTRDYNKPVTKKERLARFWKNRDVDGSMASNSSVLEAKRKRAREKQDEM